MKNYIFPAVIAVFIAAHSVSGMRLCDIFIINAKGSRVTASVETAFNDIERSRGLMFRRGLSRDSGMLFIFGDEKIRSFWMKNTFIPLSIAFIDSNGKIIDIRDMIPHDETPVSSAGPAKYALEMNLGWFSENSIHTGCRIIKDGCLSK